MYIYIYDSSKSCLVLWLSIFRCILLFRLYHISRFLVCCTVLSFLLFFAFFFLLDFILLHVIYHVCFDCYPLFLFVRICLLLFHIIVYGILIPHSIPLPLCIWMCNINIYIYIYIYMHIYMCVLLLYLFSSLFLLSLSLSASFTLFVLWFAIFNVVCFLFIFLFRSMCSPSVSICIHDISLCFRSFFSSMFLSLLIFFLEYLSLSLCRSLSFCKAMRQLAAGQVQCTQCKARARQASGYIYKKSICICKIRKLFERRTTRQLAF